MSRKPLINLTWIAALLLGLLFGALPTGFVSAASGSTVSAAKQAQLDKAFITQVKELAYQKELLAYAKDRLEVVLDIQSGYNKADAAYNTLQWNINHLNTYIATAEAAIGKADKLLKDHKGFEIEGSGFKVRISKVTDGSAAEATIKAATEQVSLSGTNLRRAMRVMKKLIKEYEG